MATLFARQFVAESIKQKPWSGPVIDLGAGPAAKCYQDLFDGHIYLTLDFEKSAEYQTDYIADIMDMNGVPREYFGVALLLETLEHLKNPFIAFEKISQIIRPGGLFICTTVAAWMQHNHPSDYWRFLMAGLKLLCEHANLKPYYQKQTTASTQIPCQTMIAAIK